MELKIRVLLSVAALAIVPVFNADGQNSAPFCNKEVRQHGNTYSGDACQVSGNCQTGWAECPGSEYCASVPSGTGLAGCGSPQVVQVGCTFYVGGHCENGRCVKDGNTTPRPDIVHTTGITKYPYADPCLEN